MHDRSSDDPNIWEDMRERLMSLTVKQLKQIAKDEGISLGYDASRKDTTVGAIVTARRQRAMEATDDPGLHPWRRWRSLEHVHPAVRGEEATA